MKNCCEASNVETTATVAQGIALEQVVARD
jgi:hypothetical protein